jgi:GxxExxY protein
MVDSDGLNTLSFRIIESAIAVHTELGPGLLESTYRAGMLHELRLAHLSVASELQVPILYKGVLLDGGYRIDLLVENEVIVELKSVETILPVHLAQLLYLRLKDKRLGLLINFNVPRLSSGVRRVVNRF